MVLQEYSCICIDIIESGCVPTHFLFENLLTGLIYINESSKKQLRKKVFVLSFRSKQPIKFVIDLLWSDG